MAGVETGLDACTQETKTTEDRIDASVRTAADEIPVLLDECRVSGSQQRIQIVRIRSGLSRGKV